MSNQYKKQRDEEKRVALFFFVFKIIKNKRKNRLSLQLNK